MATEPLCTKIPPSTFELCEPLAIITSWSLIARLVVSIVVSVPFTSRFPVIVALPPIDALPVTVRLSLTVVSDVV